MFANALAILWAAYPLYYPQYISGYEKVKITTMTQTSMTETEPLTRRIVIFGAAGDLAKRKLIPALYELWKNYFHIIS